MIAIHRAPRTVIATLFAAGAALLAIPAPLSAAAVDFSGYDAGGTIAVASPDPATLVAEWSDKEGAGFRATFNLDAGEPLLRRLETAPSGGGFGTVADDVDARFRVTLGRRHSQTSWPYVFFETIDSNQPAPQAYLSELDTDAVAVVSDSANRVRIVFSGLHLGPYFGELTCTIYHGSPFLHFQASMHVTDPWVSYIHDSLFYADFETIAYKDRFGALQTAASASLPAAVPGESAGLQVKHRTIMGRQAGGGGTLAVVAPPHTCVYPLDFSVNLGVVQAGRGFIGTKMSHPGDGRYRPWVDAPQDSVQRMDVFLLISPDEAEVALDRVLPYTNGDTFKELPGRYTMAEHFHPEFTAAYRAGGDTVTSFVAAMKEMNVRMVQLMEFHGPGNPFNNEAPRLSQLRDMYTLLAAHSDEDLLLIPGEEYNEFFGGHWSYMFGKPVYFTGWPGQSGRTYRRENVVSEGHTYPVVYEIGDAAHMLQLLRDEGGIAWTAHPRIKDSRQMPDIYMNSDFYKDPVFQAGDWKAMPLDLSHDRLGMRGFQLMDDTAQLGFRKHMLGEVDTFTLDPTHEIYAHMNVNYLALPEFPSSGDWTSVVNCLKEGDFFTSTGEVLIHSWNATAGGVTAEVEWYFPPAFAEITWGDANGIHKLKKPITDGLEFTTGQIVIDADLSGANWVRFEAWDIARNGAFTQPFWFAEPANPATVIGSVTGFTLFDADTDAPIPGYDPIPPGAVLDRSTLPANLNIRANTVPMILERVELTLNGGAPIVELTYPYTAGPAAVNPGLRGCPFFDYAPLTLPNGANTLTATPSRGGVAGGTATLAFTVTGTPPPPVPAGLTATPGGSSVLLAWAPSAGATTYHVKRATRPSGPFAEIGTGPDTLFTDDNVAAGTTYYYVVSASAASTSRDSTMVSATPGLIRTIVGGFGQGVQAGVDVPVGNAPGWHAIARAAASGTVQNYTASIPAPTADYPNLANNPGGAAGTQGYLVMGLNTLVNPVFVWYDTTISHSGQTPRSVSFYSRNNHASSSVKVAVRIGDDWYLSTHAIHDTGGNSVWMPHEFQFETDAGLWRTFDPATLSSGGILSDPLPGGAVTGIGLFGEVPVSGKIRIDEVTLATLPAPGIEDFILGRFHEGVQAGVDVPVGHAPGWHASARAIASGTVQDYTTAIPAPTADYPNLADNPGGAAGTQGYLVMGLNTLVNPVFTWLDTTAMLSGRMPRHLDFYTRNNHASSSVRIAVRIGDAWYLSTQAIHDGGGNSVWMRHRFHHTRDAAAWQAFDAAALQPGASLAQPLPGGYVTGIGFFGQVPASGKIRLDEVTLQAVRLTPYQQWQVAEFGDLEDPDAAPLAEPRGDGVPNVIRYALGIGIDDPAAPSMPKMETAGDDGGPYLALSYTELADAPDVTYIVEVGGNLGEWFFGPEHTTTVSSTPHGETRTVVVRDNIPIHASDRRFIRLKVEVAGTTGWVEPD